MSQQTRRADKGTVNEKDALPTSEVYHLLSNDRRRQVMDIVERHGPIRKSELVDRVAAAEFEDEPSSQERKRILVSLHQAHLPKLEDAGVIQWDRDTIRRANGLARVAEYRHDSRAGPVDALLSALR